MGTLQGLDKFKISGASGSNIKSIQRGSYQMGGATGTEITFAISEVDPNSSVVTISQNPHNYNGQLGEFAIELVDSTHFKIKHLTTTSTGTNITIYWEVIEFNNVKSKQTGSVTIASAGVKQTINISQINASKSLMFISKTSSYTSGARASDYAIGYGIKSDTTLEIIGNATEVTVYWQVIEFN